MKIEICDFCRINPEETIELVPATLSKYEYKNKFWSKKEKVVICKYCLKEIFSKRRESRKKFVYSD